MASSDGPDDGTAKTIASSPPVTPATISGTEATLAPSEPPAPATIAAPRRAPATPPRTTVEVGPTDDYAQLVTVDPRHYVLSGEVARGGMGRILRARDRRLGRTIAVKELLVGDATLVARFEREARITARLQHPAIVALHEAGRWPTGEPFFAMKLVSGRPLDQVIGAARTLRERLALLPNVISVVDALAYAHSEGIVHRDLKPANVLVGDFGETVVIDWGLAKDLAADESEVSPLRDPAGPTSVTRSRDGDTVAGSVLGTPAYMPPEQAAGEKVDARADVYALGALLYHVLAGRPPYEAKSVETMLAKVLGGPPPHLTTVAPEVPSDLVAIVDKAMAREPVDRFPTAREMVEELKRYQTGQLVTSHRYTTWELFRRWVRKHRAVVAVSALALVALVVIGAFSLSRIVAARDLARDRELEARDAQAAAERRTDQITLAQATSSLDVDPTRSLALLAQVSTARDASVVRDIRRIAADAASRGIAHLLPGNGRVHGLAIAPSGTWLAAGGLDRTIHLWNVATRTSRALVGHAHPILDVAMTDEAVWSVDDRGEIRRWSITGGASTVIRAAGDEALKRARLAPGGSAVVTLRPGRTQIVDLVSMKVLEKGTYELAAWAPDGASLVLFDDAADRVERVELATGATRHLAVPGELVTALATNGSRVIIGDENERVRDLTDEIMVSAETRHAGLITSLALLADGTIVSASSDHEYTSAHHEVERRFRSGDYTVVLWSHEPHDAVRLRGHQGNIDAVAVTPKGDVVASAGRDGTIRVWTQPRLRRYYGHAQIDAAVLSGDTRELAVINNGSELDVHEVGSDRFRTVSVTRFPPGHAPDATAGNVEPPRHQVAHIAVADGGKRFVTLDVEPAAVVWDLTTNVGRLLARDIAAIAITHDGTRVLTADPRGAVTAWDAATGAATSIAPAGKPISAVTVARSGTIAVAYLDGGVELLGPGPRRVLHAPAAPSKSTRGHQTAVGRADRRDTIASLAFSPDSATLVGGGADSALHVWDVATGALRTWRGHTDRVTNLVFSPDGSHVASASLDNTARVWRLADGDSTVLRGHAGAINTLAWRSDGACVVTAGDDRTVRLWDVPGGGHRIVARHGDYVVFAGFLAGERRVLSVDHGDEIVEAPDDLPTDEAGLRAWLRTATNLEPP